MKLLTQAFTAVAVVCPAAGLAYLWTHPGDSGNWAALIFCATAVAFGCAAVTASN